MPSSFVTLSCQVCGGNLDIYEDTDHFACSYCGTRMMVQRRSGTVALKMVENAIKKVQTGTDKTAAELAIVRYERELQQLLRDEAKFSQQRTGEILAGFAGCLVFGGLGIFIGLSLSIGLLIPSVLCAFSIYFLIRGYRSRANAFDVSPAIWHSGRIDEPHF